MWGREGGPHGSEKGGQGIFAVQQSLVPASGSENTSRGEITLQDLSLIGFAGPAWPSSL